MTPRLRPLCQILGQPIAIEMVDVGANPVGGAPPYAPLMSGHTRLVGFEPNPEALAQLNATKGPDETYLPYAVGDGKRHTLRICHEPAMTSLLEPNMAVLPYFQGFAKWGEVVRKVPIETVRLDAVSEIGRMDYLKIDIQGAELMVFRNAKRRLSECVVVHTEVEFLPLYVGQPLFSEVEQFMRGLGFVLHRFHGGAPPMRPLKPMAIESDLLRGFSQVLDCDAIFVRDFTQPKRLSADQLLRMARILNDCYGSVDLVLRLLIEHDRRTGSRFASAYMGAEVPLDQAP